MPILIDIPTLTQHLGVGERHVRRLVFERRIPFVKVGRHIRFDTSEIAQWIDEHRVSTGVGSDWHGTGER